MRRIIVGVMGPGNEATDADLASAYELGERIAKAGWVLLTGGRNVGVMDAVSRGAKSAKGLTIGILPTTDPCTLSEGVDIAIFTDMGSARNNINVLSSDVAIACGMGAGTASEIALALKADKPVILLNSDDASQIFFRNLSKGKILIAESPQDAIKKAFSILNNFRHLSKE